MTMTVPTVSVSKAMEIAGVSRRAIYLWMTHGKVQFIRTAGGSRRIVTASLFRPGNVDPKDLQAAS